MELSIAVFLMRLLACELLPTNCKNEKQQMLSRHNERIYASFFCFVPKTPSRKSHTKFSYVPSPFAFNLPHPPPRDDGPILL